MARMTMKAMDQRLSNLESKMDKLCDIMLQQQSTTTSAKKSTTKAAVRTSTKKDGESTYKGVVTVTKNGVTKYYVEGNKRKTYPSWKEAREVAKKQWVESHYSKEEQAAFAEKVAEKKASRELSKKAYEATNKHFGEKRVDSRTWHEYYYAELDKLSK